MLQGLQALQAFQAFHALRETWRPSRHCWKRKSWNSASRHHRSATAAPDAGHGTRVTGLRTRLGLNSVQAKKDPEPVKAPGQSTIGGGGGDNRCAACSLCEVRASNPEPLRCNVLQRKPSLALDCCSAARVLQRLVQFLRNVKSERESAEIVPACTMPDSFTYGVPLEFAHQDATWNAPSTGCRPPAWASRPKPAAAT